MTDFPRFDKSSNKIYFITLKCWTNKLNMNQMGKFVFKLKKRKTCAKILRGVSRYNVTIMMWDIRLISIQNNS